jgi:hypothetical protein
MIDILRSFFSAAESTAATNSCCHIIGAKCMLTSHSCIAIRIECMYECLSCACKKLESVYDIVNKHNDLTPPKLLHIADSGLPVYKELGTHIRYAPCAYLLIFVVCLILLDVHMTIPAVVHLYAANVRESDLGWIHLRSVQYLWFNEPRLVGILVAFGAK